MLGFDDKSEGLAINLINLMNFGNFVDSEMCVCVTWRKNAKFLVKEVGDKRIIPSASV